MLACVDVYQLTVTPRDLFQRRFHISIINSILDEHTVDLIAYHRLMKNPNYRPLYRKSYSKDLGRLAQQMPSLSEGNNTIFFIPKK